MIVYTRKESERCAALTDHQLIERKNKKRRTNGILSTKGIRRCWDKEPRHRSKGNQRSAAVYSVEFSFADKLKDLLLLVSCHEFLSAYLLILIAQLFIMFADASGLAASSRLLLFLFILQRECSVMGESKEMFLIIFMNFLSTSLPSRVQPTKAPKVYCYMSGILILWCNCNCKPWILSHDHKTFPEH